MTPRVLHLITRLPIGGAEKMLIDIVRNLDRARYDSVVCCIQDRGELAAEIVQMGVPLFCLHRMQSKRFDFRAVTALKGLIRREHIGLVHSHLYHANLYGRLAALLAGVPAVATVHNTYTRRKLHRRLLNYGLSRASARVVAVSEDIRRDLLRYDWVAASKVVTISNGIDVRRIETSITRHEARQRLGIADDALVLGCVGRLEEQKGHRFLLEALALLHRDATFTARPILMLAGDGRLRKQLEEQAFALGVAPWTSFLGMRRDIAEILKALDLFVMPSLWEGLSIAMLEAMAAGLPLVVSDVGGVSEAVAEDGQFAIKVPPGNVAGLAAGLRMLIEDPDRRTAFAASAKRRVAAKFGSEAMMRELTRVYDQATATERTVRA